MKTRYDQIRRMYEHKIDELEQRLHFYKYLSAASFILMLFLFFVLWAVEKL